MKKKLLHMLLKRTKEIVKKKNLKSLVYTIGISGYFVIFG